MLGTQARPCQTVSAGSSKTPQTGATVHRGGAGFGRAAIQAGKSKHVAIHAKLSCNSAQLPSRHHGDLTEDATSLQG